MKNCEKYRTAEDRTEAFDEFCRKHNGNPCEKCTAYSKGDLDWACEFRWLDLEEEKNEILNCSYCGDKCVCEKDDYGNWIVRCENCLYEMGGQEWSESEVIRRHNNVARVMLEGRK